MEIPEPARPFFLDEDTYCNAWEWYSHWFPTDPTEQIEDETMTWEKLAKRWREMNPLCVREEW